MGISDFIIIAVIIAVVVAVVLKSTVFKGPRWLLESEKARKNGDGKGRS